jgi:hypothetical protein
VIHPQRERKKNEKREESTPIILDAVSRLIFNSLFFLCVFPSDLPVVERRGRMEKSTHQQACFFQQTLPVYNNQLFVITENPILVAWVKFWHSHMLSINSVGIIRSYIAVRPLRRVSVRRGKENPIRQNSVFRLFRLVGVNISRMIVTSPYSDANYTCVYKCRAVDDDPPLSQ